jgi:hypothetical protein
VRLRTELRLQGLEEAVNGRKTNWDDLDGPLRPGLVKTVASHCQWLANLEADLLVARQVNDRIDRLEYRLKHGDSQYGGYADLRREGMTHAEASKAMGLAISRAKKIQGARIEESWKAAHDADINLALDRARDAEQQDLRQQVEELKAQVRSINGWLSQGES